MSLVARVIRTSAPGDNPKIAPLAERARFDLQVPGHTHAGQLFPWTFVIHLVHGPHAAGLSRRGRLWVYVSAGTGTWGPGAPRHEAGAHPPACLVTPNGPRRRQAGETAAAGWSGSKGARRAGHQAGAAAVCPPQTPMRDAVAVS